MEKKLADLRENYGIKELNANNCPDNPFVLFDLWLNEAMDTIPADANAMTLSTVGADGQPSSRTVLLKGVNEQEFLFFTHYTGKKGWQIEENPKISLLFWWKELERQVRIEGVAKKVSREKSEDYFHTRPKGSQIGAAASPQSQVIIKEELIKKFIHLENLYQDTDNIPLPENWGGYAVTPNLIEFWQGRPNRMHDRVEYKLQNQLWIKQRLAP